MARRWHFSDVGTIASFSDISAVGAGESDRWLDDPNVFVAIHGAGLLALAHARRNAIVILPVGSDHVSHGLVIRPHLRADVGEGALSAVEWVLVGEHLVLAAGTTNGMLLIYTADGDLIHKQSIYPGRILRLRFRVQEVNSLRELQSEELSVVFPGVVARFVGTDLQVILHRWFQNLGPQIRRSTRFLDEPVDESSFERIPFLLWSISKFKSCTDAAIIGLMPPPLLEFQSSKRFYSAVTVGEDTTISAYRLSEDRSRSIVGTIFSTVSGTAYSTISSFSKMVWRSPETTTKARPKPPSFANAALLTCLKDPPRKGEKLTLSPTGMLAAVTDSLGRILLVDTRAFVALRLWKGYRDASCLFVEMLVKREKPSSSSAYREPTKGDYCLCLAIHAPRKGIIEVWQMRTGPRVLAVQCPKGCKMLQPSTKLSMRMSSSSYVPLELFLLNGDTGQLLLFDSNIGVDKC